MTKILGGNDMKATVNKNTCIGCGVCTSIASSIFALTDDGLAGNLFGEEVPNEFEDSVNEASEACPVSAIEIE
jgi:ferredoxin